MNDHMQGVNMDVNAIYFMAYLVPGFTWIYALVHGFLDEFWESMLLIMESPMIKTIPVERVI